MENQYYLLYNIDNEKKVYENMKKSQISLNKNDDISLLYIIIYLK